MTPSAKPMPSAKLTLSPPVPGLDVSFVVGTYGNVEFTRQMLASLARSMSGLRYEVIFVDNGSEDGTVQFIGTHTPGQKRGRAQGDAPPVRVTLLHNPVPRTLSVSWNMGLEAALGRHIIVSNNDVIYTPGAVRAMLNAADSEWQAGIVFPFGPGDIRGPKAVVKPPDTADATVENILAVEEWEAARQKRGGMGGIQFEPNAYVPQGGFCFLVTRACLGTIGGFCTEFELTGEDYDLFKRAQRHFKMVRVPGAYVEHFEHQTCAALGLEYNERMCRNRFLLAEKHESTLEMVSVVMPTFQRTDALEAAIDSVLSQTFPHWRLYIIDDGSKDWDKISLMLRKYDFDRSRIWHFHYPENRGPGGARNYGLAQTRGKYVAFLDSDDVWYPDHLRKHFEAHERGAYALVYSNPDFAWRQWNPSASRYVHQPDTHPTIDYFGAYDKDLLLQKNYIQTSSTTLWGELARSLRFNDQRIEEDWEYFKQAADAGGAGRKVLHLDEPTCRYHIARLATEEDHLVKRATGQFAAPDNAAETLIELPPKAELSGADEGGQVDLIGVVIPTHDRPDDLRRALRSVGVDAPIIVVDDAGFYGSTAADVVTGANARGECRAGLLRTSTGKGASWARNRGIERLGTEWVQFLDDDDLLIHGWHASLLPHLVPGTDAVVSSAFVPRESGPGMRIDDEVYTSQLCVRKAALLEAGLFTEDLFWAEERDLLTRMERMGMTIVRTGIPLVFRPQRGGSGVPATGEKALATVASAGWQLGKHGA